MSSAYMHIRCYFLLEKISGAAQNKPGEPMAKAKKKRQID